MQLNNFYNIKPNDVKKGNIIFINRSNKYEVLDDPVFEKAICTIRVKNQAGTEETLKFNLHAESTIFVTKLDTNWKPMFNQKI